MKQYIYTYKDDKLGVYARPWFNNMNPEEMKEITRRSSLKDDQLKEVAGLSLYKIGIYEDATGEIIQEKEFIVTIPTPVITRKGQKNENKKQIHK